MLMIDEEEITQLADKERYRKPCFSEAFWRRAYAKDPDIEDGEACHLRDDVNWRNFSPGGRYWLSAA